MITCAIRRVLKKRIKPYFTFQKIFKRFIGHLLIYCHERQERIFVFNFCTDNRLKVVTSGG